MITRIKITLKNGKTRLLNLGINNIEKVDKTRPLFIQLENGSSFINVTSEGILTEGKELCLNEVNRERSFSVPVFKIFGWCYAA